MNVRQTQNKSLKAKQWIQWNKIYSLSEIESSHSIRINYYIFYETRKIIDIKKK